MVVMIRESRRHCPCHHTQDTPYTSYIELRGRSRGPLRLVLDGQRDPTNQDNPPSGHHVRHTSGVLAGHLSESYPALLELIRHDIAAKIHEDDQVSLSAKESKLTM